MRFVVLGVAATFLGCRALAAEPDAAEEHLKSVALDCIRTHAAEVERLEPSLSGATTFLVSDLCAAQIAAHDRFVANTRLLASMRAASAVSMPDEDEGGTKADKDRVREQTERAQAAWRSTSVDPLTGELKPPADSGAGAGWTVYAPGSVPLGRASEIFVTTAAEAVLSARTARLGKRP